MNSFKITLSNLKKAFAGLNIIEPIMNNGRHKIPGSFFTLVFSEPDKLKVTYFGGSQILAVTVPIIDAKIDLMVEIFLDTKTETMPIVSLNYETVGQILAIKDLAGRSKKKLQEVIEVAFDKDCMTIGGGSFVFCDNSFIPQVDKVYSLNTQEDKYLFETVVVDQDNFSQLLRLAMVNMDRQWLNPPNKRDKKQYGKYMFTFVLTKHCLPFYQVIVWNQYQGEFVSLHDLTKAMISHKILGDDSLIFSYNPEYIYDVMEKFSCTRITWYKDTLVMQGDDFYYLQLRCQDGKNDTLDNIEKIEKYLLSKK